MLGQQALSYPEMPLRRPGTLEREFEGFKCVGVEGMAF